MTPVKLSDRHIERLFDRLMAVYGREFLARYEDMALADVKAAWALELGGFEDRRLLPSIAWALEHLPERAPNAVEFRALCRRAPIEPVPAPALPALKETDTQRAWREAHAQVIASGEAGGNEDGKKWARALLAMETRVSAATDAAFGGNGGGWQSAKVDMLC